MMNERQLLGCIPRVLSDEQLGEAIAKAQQIAGRLRQDAQRTPLVQPRADAMYAKARELQAELDRR